MFGPDNPQFNQDAYQVLTIWLVINLIFSDILPDKPIFSSIAGSATFRRRKETIGISTIWIGSTNTKMNSPKPVRHQEHRFHLVGLISPKHETVITAIIITITITIKTLEGMCFSYNPWSCTLKKKMENKAVTNEEKRKFYYLRKKKSWA